MSASQSLTHLVGREKESQQIKSCLKAKKNVLLEGPVGVGKTHLALSITQGLGVPVFRIDGDQRFSEQKLTGWFDPPLVLKKGYHAESFIPGPLVEAMKAGGILFINELNRLPEGVQNVLLPAIDERMVGIPRLGTIHAAPGFLVIATQNPREFVATSHLSEAILDRFELIILGYQTEAEEAQMVSEKLKLQQNQELPLLAVKLIRMTRNHPRVKRGASVRAALSVAEIASVLMRDEKMALLDALLLAAQMALPTRIELERDSDQTQAPQEEMTELLKEWIKAVLDGSSSIEGQVKKKSFP